MSAALSESEWERLLQLSRVAALGTELTASQKTEMDALSPRMKIRKPNAPPSTIGIPVIRPWDQLCIMPDGTEAPIA